MSDYEPVGHGSTVLDVVIGTVERGLSVSIGWPLIERLGRRLHPSLSQNYPTRWPLTRWRDGSGHQVQLRRNEFGLA